MVVTQLANEYFLQDLPDMEITSVTDAVSMTVTIGGNSLELVYYPNNGQVTVRGLAETIQRLYPVHDVESISYNSNGASSVNAGETLTVKVVSGESQSTQQTNVRYCIHHTRSTMANEGVILSRYSERVYEVEDSIYFSFLVSSANVTMTARLICLGTTNDIYRDVSFTHSYTGANYLASYKLTPAMLAQKANVAVDKIMKAIFIVSVSGSAVDSFECTINHNGRRHKAVFVYDNAFGVPESIAFLGSEEEKEQYEAELVHTQSGYASASRVNPAVRTINTGPMSEEKYYSALDMLYSDNVYLLMDNTLKKVAIKGFENVKQMPRYSCLSGSLTYTLSDQKQTIGRTTSAEGDLFDDPFSQVFD